MMLLPSDEFSHPAKLSKNHLGVLNNFRMTGLIDKRSRPLQKVRAPSFEILMQDLMANFHGAVLKDF